MVRHNVEPDVVDVHMQIGEDGELFDGKHNHVVQLHDFRVHHH